MTDTPNPAQLHIWGPGFGLPSIDAECLATIYYLRNTLSDRDWVLVPSSNPNCNPFQHLPALCDQGVWVAGFEQIQHYLSDRANEPQDLDNGLSDVQKSDCDAYKSFLFSRGLPLLDLSLYVSSDNYVSCTRRTLGDLLTWPQSWTLPQELRERAKKRSEHLGLSGLDVDAAKEEEDNDAGLAAHIPKTLRKPKQTVSGLLGRGAQRTRFRLDAATEDFLQPLQSKLGKNEWLIADKMCSADCLAIAVITLMQDPVLPQAWLRNDLQKKYTTLSQWASGHATSAGNGTERGLPWQFPSSLGWKESSVLAMEAIVSGIPFVRSGYQYPVAPKHARRQLQTKGDHLDKQMTYARMRDQQRLYSSVVMACLGLTSVLGSLAYSGFSFWHRYEPASPSRRSFGEAGALLGL